MSYSEEIILTRPRQFLPKQKEVFDLIFKVNIGDNGKPITNYGLYSGAFGAGKTMLLAHVGIKAALDYPKSIGFVGSLTYNQIRDVVFRKFCNEIEKYQETLNASNIPVKLATFTTSPGKMNINFYNGSEIWFRSCDNERNLAGKDLDWFALDEPVDLPEGVMTQLIGRLRGENIPFHFGLLATNPGAENHWIYKYFYMDKKPGYFAVDTSTYDNILIPNQEEYIKSMESRYDTDWVRRYLKGVWGAFSGQIYKTFNQEKHTRKFDQELKNVPGIDRYFAGVDWGIRDPCCILVLMKTKANNLFVIEEYYESEKSSFETAHRIAELHKKYNFTKVYCDPSAADLVKQTHDLGVPIGRFDNGEIKSYANNAVSPGIAKLQSTFKNNKITIHTSCVNLVRSLLAYRYKNDGETPLKEDDHAADALRYALTDYSPIPDETMFGCGRFIGKYGNLKRAT
jgi:PBSX family phage terminase large subunit